MTSVSYANAAGVDHPYAIDGDVAHNRVYIGVKAGTGTGTHRIMAGALDGADDPVDLVTDLADHPRLIRVGSQRVLVLMGGSIVSYALDGTNATTLTPSNNA